MYALSVCMLVYMCACMLVCVYVCMDAYIHVCMCVVCVYVSPVCMQARIYVHIHISPMAHHLHTYIHTYTHTHIHISTHIYQHICRPQKRIMPIPDNKRHARTRLPALTTAVKPKTRVQVRLSEPRKCLRFGEHLRPIYISKIVSEVIDV